MNSGMPELGSKISLISKADIRYEGRLFTVDPQECTIALASVRSFGTEDRETQFPVSPQSLVYDFILFRGSDIKDIRVLNNVPSMPNDPAIMQMSVPPSLGSAGSAGPFGGQFSHPVVGQVGQGQFAQYHPMAGFPGSVHASLNKTSELSPGAELNPPPAPIGSGVHHVNQVKDQGSMLDLIGGGSQQSASRSGTPAAAHRKSPTADQGTQQVGAGGSRDGRRGSAGSKPRTSSRTRQRYPSGPQPHHNQHQQHNQNQQHNQQHQQHNQQHQQHNQQHQQHNQHQQHDQHQQHNQHQQHHHQSGVGGALGARGGGGGGGGGGVGGGWRGGRGGGRGRGAPRGFGPHPRGPKNTLKFDSEYDFEQANTEFEELRSQLAKTKISDDTKVEVTPPVATPLPTPGAGAEADKKDDSGNETGAGEAEPDDDPFTGYDKAKSFFDNISCEAVERSKGRSQRTDWRTERKLNSETFGVASARRGAWRGRGGWRHGLHQPWRPMRGGRGRGGPHPHGPPSHGPHGQPAPARGPRPTPAQPTAPTQPQLASASG